MNRLHENVSSNTGVVIGIPTLGRLVNLNYVMMFKALTPPINFNTVFHIIEGKPVADAREEMCEHAINIGARYLFFLGDDMIVPPHTLRQLVMRMENNKDLAVVGGIYCSKSDPPAPLVFRGNGQGSYWEWKIGEFFEVTGLGMDCTLIRLDILKNLSKPWFKTLDTDQFKDGINNAEQWTEDIYFCKKVIEETNSKVYADATVICEHWNFNERKYYTLPKDSMPMQRISINGLKKAIDIGCGPIDRSQEPPFTGYHLTRADIRENCNPDYRCDVRELPFADKSFDRVFSSHVLEHFNRSEWESVLSEWIRLIKPDGDLLLYLPNIEWAAKRIVNDRTIDGDVLNVLYGAQTNPYDFHYNGLTPDIMKYHLEKFGMEIVSVDHVGYNMIINAKFKELSDANADKINSDSASITASA